MENGEDLVYVLRRKSDGKYFRGSRFWAWTRNPKRAAALTNRFWDWLLTGGKEGGPFDPRLKGVEAERIPQKERQ